MKMLRLIAPVYLSLAVFAMLLSAMQTAYAADGDYTVCPAGPPQCGYKSIQAAVDAAPSGSTVLVAKGIYRDVHDRPRYGNHGDEAVKQVVYITKSLTLRGGYLAPNFDAPPDPTANLTVLDAQDKGRVAYLLGAGEPITVEISGFQIMNGLASGGDQLYGGRDAGGGLYVVSTTLRLENSVVMSNTSYARAAGMYLYHSNATLRGNQVVGNRVYGMSAINCCSGGGIVSDWSNSFLLDNVISDNSAELTGGVDCWNGKLTMVNNVISGNVGMEGSGGVLVVLSDAIIRSNRFVNNIGSGLWIWHSSGESVIAYNRFDGNLGGARIGPNSFGPPDSSALVVGNRFVGNDYVGLNIDSQPNVRAVNNVFQGNSASGFAAVRIDDATVDMLHTTVSGLPGHGGVGIQIGFGAAGTRSDSMVTLTNSIISGQDVGISVTEGASATVAGVLWQGNGMNVDNAGTYIESGAISGDPKFAADGYHLLVGSAAIDAGIDADVPDDIDQFPRPYQAPDLGADEYWPREALHWMYAPAVLNGK